MKAQTNHRQYRGMSKSEVVSAIRREFMTNPKKFAAIQKQAVRTLLPQSDRWKTLIRCAQCQELFNRDDIQCNHKNPVGPLLSTSAKDIASYRQRMFRPVAELEALCIACHRQHTQQHQQKRKLHEDQPCTH